MPGEFEVKAFDSTKFNYRWYMQNLTLPAKLNFNSLPDAAFMRKFCSMFSSLHDVALFTSLLYRICFPLPKLHTCYVISGPPSSGKSVLTAIFKNLLNTPCTSVGVKDISNSFYFDDIANKRAVVLAEIFPKALEGDDLGRRIKQMTSRDPISGTRKHENGLRESTFEGVLIAQSNFSVIELLGGTNLALWSRFINIKTARLKGRADILQIT